MLHRWAKTTASRSHVRQVNTRLLFQYIRKRRFLEKAETEVADCVSNTLKPVAFVSVLLAGGQGRTAGRGGTSR